MLKVRIVDDGEIVRADGLVAADAEAMYWQAMALAEDLDDLRSEGSDDVGTDAEATAAGLIRAAKAGDEQAQDVVEAAREGLQAAGAGSQTRRCGL